MFCVKCGKEVKEGTKFCTNCGAEIKEVKKEDKEEKLTYSQNKSIETTSNKTPVVATNTSTSEKDGKATASLVLGIVSLVIWCVAPITSIVGLILGICSKKSGKKVAGIILNAISLGFSIIGLILLFGFGYFAAIVDEYDPSVPSTPSIITPSKPSTVRVGRTFTFDDYEITIGNNYSFTTVNNSYSEHYGKDVIKLPVTIKNVTTKDNDHLNMYYYQYYGPSGKELPSLRSYFSSAAIDYMYVDSGETITKYFYILYDGDGKYKIHFDNHKEEKDIEFTIKK